MSIDLSRKFQHFLLTVHTSCEKCAESDEMCKIVSLLDGFKTKSASEIKMLEGLKEECERCDGSSPYVSDRIKIHYSYF